MSIWYGITGVIETSVLLIPARCEDREVLLAPCTRSLTGFLIESLRHVVHDRIFPLTIRTGEMNTIPDSRPNNSRF